MPNIMNPTVFMLKLANIWTNQELYILLLFLFNQLKNKPDMKRPEIVRINNHGLNQSARIAT
jgi:hypothetical protein